MESTWMHAKKGLRNQNGGSSANLEGYLYEFLFKKKFVKDTRLNELIIILADMTRHN
jgi:hypothetical protein